MKNYLKFTKFYSLVFTFLTGALILTGCLDNSEDKAAKDIIKATDKAIETVVIEKDLDSARRRLRPALTGPRSASAQKSSALIANAELSLAQARKELSGTADAVKVTNSILTDMNEQITDINRSEIKIQQIKSLMQSSKTEIMQYENMLSGSADKQGLTQKLVQQEKSLAKLMQRKDELNSQARQVKEVLSEIQTEGDQIIQSAENMTGAKKAETIKKGYAVLLEKKEYLSQQQQLEDAVAYVQNQIDLLSPMIEKTKEHITEIQNRIEQVKSSQNNRQLNEQISDLENKISQKSNNIIAQLDKLKKQQEQFSQTIQNALKLAQEAVDDAGAVTDRELRVKSDQLQADGHFFIGTAFSENVNYHTYLIASLGSLSKVIESEPVDKIAQFAETLKPTVKDNSGKGLENFDKAAAFYEDLSSSVRDNVLECEMKKARLLSLYGKMILADFAGNIDAFNSSSDMVDKLMPEAKQCDPDFDRSVAGRLLTGSLAFVPNMAVDETTYFQQRQKDFQQMISNLPSDPQQRKARAEELLAQLDKLRERNSEKFDAILGPVKQKLQSELTSEEPAAGTGFVPGGRVSDANDSGGW